MTPNALLSRSRFAPNIILPKPPPVIPERLKTAQRGKQGGFMTLAAAFRGPKGGIVLCADREWSDAGITKRETEKIYWVDNLKSCEVFLAASGPDAPVLRAYSKIPEALYKVEESGRDALLEHQEIIETELLRIDKQFARLLGQWPMSLLIVVAPRSIDKVPMLYWADGPALNANAYYHAIGSGKPIADYLADRLYEHGRHTMREVATIAAFILREAAASSLGVGMGANMAFIHEGEKAIGNIPPPVIKQMQDGIPPLADAIRAYWLGRLNFPDWMGS
jgi:20S proteasome alpha/beta subunit